MSYCRSINELESINELKLSEEALQLIKDLPISEMVLLVRNAKFISYFVDKLDREAYTDEEWDEEYSRLYKLYAEIRRAVSVAGFIRNELFDLVSPESYFVHEYVRTLSLLDGDFEKCMPFYSSNEIYETYEFSYERLKKILEMLESELTAKQYSAVKGDIMYLDGYFSTDTNLDSAKLHLVLNQENVNKKILRIWS